MKKIVLLLSLAIGIISCNEKIKEKSTPTNIENQTSIAETDHLKVYINKSGLISIDGESKTIEDLENSFKELKKNNGTVYYSRSQDYEGDVTIEVIDLVAKYELPIALFTDNSFSEKVKY
jgi:biopolymer transport protein ExbD